MNSNRYVVIPTKNRHDCLKEAIVSITSEECKPYVIVIENGMSFDPLGASTFYYVDNPPSISRMWNIGLNHAAEMASHASHAEWYVAIINDDVVIPPGWFDAVVRAMDDTGADLGCADQHGFLTGVYFSRNISDYTLHTRVCGYAYVLRGTSQLRLDESMRWWYSDDDLDWQARNRGGLVITPGYAVEHKHPNAQTNANPELIAQTAKDRATFIKKWGRAPW